MKDKTVTRDWLKSVGFEEVPTFTVMNSLTLHLTRGRILSIGCVNEPNEMMFMQQMGEDNIAEDLICVHNYDYDGYLTKPRMSQLYFGLTGKALEEKIKEKDLKD